MAAAMLQLNWLAIIAAATAGFALGAFWYGIFAKPWMAATGVSMDAIRDEHGRMRGGPAPFIIAAICQLVLATSLAGILVHTGAQTLGGGLLAGFLIWLGFVITTKLVNNSFAMRKPMVSVIDGGYWLVVFLVEGALLGFLGLN